MKRPKPEEIRAGREARGLTQTQAAKVIGKSLGAWQKWESVESSARHRKMDPAYWELFQIKSPLPAKAKE